VTLCFWEWTLVERVCSILVFEKLQATWFTPDEHDKDDISSWWLLCVPLSWIYNTMLELQPKTFATTIKGEYRIYDKKYRN